MGEEFRLEKMQVSYVYIQMWRVRVAGLRALLWSTAYRAMKQNTAKASQETEAGEVYGFLFFIFWSG